MGTQLTANGGGSTDLITYLNYISTWEDAVDADVQSIIDEQNLFINVGDFDSDSVVEKQIGEAYSLACTVRDLTIAADSIQMATDVAAVASIWSFGIGMAAFVVLEATEMIDKAVISSKSKDLTNKLMNLDTDISVDINDQVKNYVTKFKANNKLIISKAPKGLDTQHCRADLMQFMAQIHHKETLTPASFKKWAGSARLLYESKEIEKVYDALDELNLSGKTNTDLKKFMNSLKGLNFQEKWIVNFVQGISIMIVARSFTGANQRLRLEAEEAGLPLEEVSVARFEQIDALGKVAGAIMIIAGVVDIVLDVYDIVEVVKQCKALCDELNTTVKSGYKSYYNGIKEASKQYRAAIATPAIEEIVGSYECHKYDSGGKNDWHYVTVTKIDNSTLKWTNRANVSWTLTLTADKDILNVGDKCPFYHFNDGKQQTNYTEAAIVRNGSKVTGIMGPWNELYSKSA
jgi:hypothetical protein